MKILPKLVWLSVLAGATTLALVACDDLIATNIGPLSLDGGLNGFEASVPETTAPDGSSPNPDATPTVDAAGDEPDGGTTTLPDGATVLPDGAVDPTPKDAGAMKDADNADACVDAAVVNDGMGQLKVICFEAVPL